MKINGTNPIATIFDNHQKSSPSKQTFQEVSTQDQDGTRAIALARYEELKLLRGKNSITLIHPDDADKYYQELSEKYDIHNLTSDEAVELGLSLDGSGLLSDEESHAVVLMCLIIWVQKDMPYTTDPNATYDVFSMIDNQLRTDLMLSKNEKGRKAAYDLWGPDGHARRCFKRLERRNPLTDFRPLNYPVQITKEQNAPSNKKMPINIAHVKKYN